MIDLDDRHALREVPHEELVRRQRQAEYACMDVVASGYDYPEPVIDGLFAAERAYRHERIRRANKRYP